MHKLLPSGCHCQKHIVCLLFRQVSTVYTTYHTANTVLYQDAGNLSFPCTSLNMQQFQNHASDITFRP